ncbi:hypothetical protein RJZ56_007399 [Blastomyces dermatitidis]|uniref:Uncharacterized protein n=3 Tax=Blastomyces TaxID=229219 RepID=A0A179U7L2_BLAGS|nr:uncharacterized protein BDBG_00652 [Blastomyces gilchristii SLH14081]XP_031575941.1 hypothetical protein, variant [Blastomyces gilchristii SLH14081]XP_045277823.1 uncharacterized protein BDCG_06376 [Blastomyces dermatitidis ER-3]XP_045281664.1 hypothetical protein, variant [Blastomyces dermatitidis ER-3]EGE85218.1 COG3602 family protein [Blastomyces dermatitidis ATCC 18188]EQL31362.1 hypothetical protein BDFG_06306 [Blastomyces dermatitidis ATCC 26199]EEQ91256.1 hypothetical protein BDCG_0
MNPSPGETNLPTLLASLNPTLDPETFVFLTTKEPMHSLPLQSLQAQMLFQESEGVTIITTRDLATSHGFGDQATFPCRKISLKIHSSLEAVGLIAAIAAKLGEGDISSNVVSGYFHDHIFVPVGREEEALRALHELAEQAGSS